MGKYTYVYRRCIFNIVNLFDGGFCSYVTNIDKNKISRFLLEQKLKFKNLVFLTVDQNDHFVAQDKYRGIISWNAKKEQILKWNT